MEELKRPRVTNEYIAAAILRISRVSIVLSLMFSVSSSLPVGLVTTMRGEVSLSLG